MPMEKSRTSKELRSVKESLSDQLGFWWWGEIVEGLYVSSSSADRKFWALPSFHTWNNLTENKDPVPWKSMWGALTRKLSYKIPICMAERLLFVLSPFLPTGSMLVATRLQSPGKRWICNFSPELILVLKAQYLVLAPFLAWKANKCSESYISAVRNLAKANNQWTLK